MLSHGQQDLDVPIGNGTHLTTYILCKRLIGITGKYFACYVEY